MGNLRLVGALHASQGGDLQKNVYIHLPKKYYMLN